MIRALLLAAAACLLAAPPARADGIDCAKAKTPVDRAICGDARLKTLDGTLATLYVKVRRTIEDEALGREFVARQRAWIQARDAACPTAEAACLDGRYAERVDDLTALAAATDDRSPVLKALDVVMLMGPWRPAGFVTPDGPVEGIENAAVGWGLPEADRLLTARPGELCAQKEGAAKPYCAAFGLQKTALAAVPDGDKLAAGLQLPATAPAFTLAGAIDPGDLLIPMPDGRLLAQFKVCLGAQLKECRLAYQVWRPAGPGARLIVR